MKNISDFFRTTAVSKLEFHGHDAEDLVISKEEKEALHRSLPTAGADDSKLSVLLVSEVLKYFPVCIIFVGIICSSE